MDKHYHVTIGISETLYNKLIGISNKFLSPEFKGMEIKFLPDELFNNEDTDAMRRYLLSTIRGIHLMKKEKDSIQ